MGLNETLILDDADSNNNATDGAQCVRLQTLEVFKWVYSEVHSYIGIVICVIGSLANLAIVSVLVRKHMHSNTNVLLLWIAVSQFLMMAACVPTYVHFWLSKQLDQMEFSATSRLWLFYFLIYTPLIVFCHSACAWLTVALAMFRLLHLTVQNAAAKSVSVAHLVSAVIFLGSLLSAVPNIMANGYSTSLEWKDNVSYEVYTIGISQFAENNEELLTIHFWISALFMRFVPSGFMLLLTAMLLYQVRLASVRRRLLHSNKHSRRQGLEAHRKRESRTTTMLTFVVATFLIVEMPQGVFAVLNSSHECFFTTVYAALGDAIDTLTLLKNLINFVVLTSMSKQFRQTFAQHAAFLVDLLTPCSNKQTVLRKTIGQTTHYKTVLMDDGAVQLIEIDRSPTAQRSEDCRRCVSTCSSPNSNRTCKVSSV